MRSRLCTGLFALWVFAGCQGEPDIFAEAYLLIDQHIAHLMEQHNTPGMVVIITDRERVLYAGAFGYENITTRQPVSPTSLFQIGSISKSFTAIALLQLVEEEILDLHRPVTDYLPWFSIQTEFEPITPHHLLTHTAGIPRDRDDIPPSWFSAYALRERQTAIPPGKQYSYSNIGYQTLGVLLESVTQLPYHEIIQRQILEPLEMTSTSPTITHDIRKTLATGYSYLYDDRPPHPSHPIVDAPFFEYSAADGSIVSNAEDMALYMRMILNKGKIGTGRLLRDDSFTNLIGEHIQLENDGKSFYGYGLQITKTGDGRMFVSHGGGMVGYRTMMIMDLTTGIGVFAAVNGPGAPAAAAHFALGVLYAALNGDPLPPVPERRNHLHVENAADYEGEFQSSGGSLLVFRAVDGSLYLIHHDEHIQLEHRGGDVFYAAHPDFNTYLFRFTRSDDTVTGVHHGSRSFYNEKYEGPVTFSFPDSWKAYVGQYRTQNPWLSNFRIILRKGQLFLVHPSGAEMKLIELESGLFRIGDESSAERLYFDAMVDGNALRANYSGVNFYRTMAR